MSFPVVRLARVSLFLVLLTGLYACAQGPFGGLGGIKDKIKEELFLKAANSLLNNELPLKLDAKTAFETVDTLPGGPFAPRAITLTPDSMSKPLAPGDYTINVTAFCTQYSVHRPGRGVAYKLAPLQGRAANAIAALLWRGMQAGVPPRHLMAVSWAIQAGLSYIKMPASIQATIDKLIPDKKSVLNADFMDDLEDTYNKAARGTKLPSFEEELGKMGATGQFVLSARRQREALMAKGVSDEVREQTLFAGEESGVYTPVTAENGPWTVRVPGVAYLRYKIEGGNLAGDNVMEIRIVGAGNGNSTASADSGPRIVNASYSGGGQAGGFLGAPTLASLLGATPNVFGGPIDADGMIGYAQGQGAQALIPVAGPGTSGPCTITPKPRVLVPRRTDLKRVGVGEIVELSVGSGSATWTIVSGGGTVDQSSGLFTAPFVDTPKVVIQATVSESSSCQIEMSVIQPDKLSFYYLPELGYGHNTTFFKHNLYIYAGVFVTPANVSFSNIGIVEFEEGKPHGNAVPVSNHLVETADGPAWYYACDQVGRNGLPYTTTSQFKFNDFRELTWQIISDVETHGDSVGRGLSISKRQVTSYHLGQPSPDIGRAAEYHITIDSPDRDLTQPGTLSNCWETYIKDQPIAGTKFTEILP